ncbi:Threonylcarbamoyl-AMP synthase [Hyphomicrobium sp. 1Nfss2.1]|uniref:L-threonylcarbamoyladenylate synthase n=1 Tax=Hyphomicrobium sp. 1Nfss2.1 TaxID=3413936 RepID=UPI003C7DF6C0
MGVEKAGKEAIAAAAEHLRAGRLVAFPTETVYGLGADATQSLAVAEIFAAKGRPTFNPLIVHVLDVAAAEQHVIFTPLARQLAGAFWPGPLTLVLEKREGSPLSDLVTGGLSSVAVRSPDHPVARALLEATGRPLAAPSANRSGHVSATKAEHVAADLGDKVAMVLDAGATAHGLESTIVDARGDHPVLLRPGAVTVETIEAVIGGKVVRGDIDAARPSAPGQLLSHYAPSARVRLDARDVGPGEALLAFGPDPLATAGAMINLSPAGNLNEAAANLFAALRALDASGAEAIAVMPIPQSGLGEAINDRLRRAAAPR